MKYEVLGEEGVSGRGAAGAHRTEPPAPAEKAEPTCHKQAQETRGRREGAARSRGFLSAIHNIRHAGFVKQFPARGGQRLIWFQLTTRPKRGWLPPASPKTYEIR
jgi:hypothetical protein